MVSGGDKDTDEIVVTAQRNDNVDMFWGNSEWGSSASRGSYGDSGAARNDLPQPALDHDDLCEIAGVGVTAWSIGGWTVIGMAAGSVVPLVGTAIGGVAGAVAGAVVGVVTWNSIDQTVGCE